MNASGAPVLWRVDADAFHSSSVLNGSTVWFLQAADGLVLSDRLLPLGRNYFLSKKQQKTHLYLKHSSRI